MLTSERLPLLKTGGKHGPPHPHLPLTPHFNHITSSPLPGHLQRENAQ